MGFMLRVRLSSFFAGAAAASVVGFFLVYKDFKAAHDGISQQVKGIREALEGRYETLNRRITALENSEELETSTQVQGSE